MSISPWVAWLISELTMLAVRRLQEAGKFDTLTEEEAKAMALQIGNSLSTNLPTPEDLEGGGT